MWLVVTSIMIQTNLTRHVRKISVTSNLFEWGCICSYVGMTNWEKNDTPSIAVYTYINTCKEGCYNTNANLVPQWHRHEIAMNITVTWILTTYSLHIHRFSAT